LLALWTKSKGNFNPLPLLVENAGGLVLVSPDNEVLEYFAGRSKGQHGPWFYGAITPSSFVVAVASRRLNLPLCFLDHSLFLEKEGTEAAGFVKIDAKGKEVVIGLMAVRGLSACGTEAIIGERIRGGDFASIEDFIRRVKLERNDIIALSPPGVFDSIVGEFSRTMQARRFLTANTGRVHKGQHELFAAEAGPSYAAKKNTVIAPHLKRQTKTDNDLWEEYRTLGFLRNVHPLALWKNEVLSIANRIKAIRIGEYIGCYTK
jgi:hypothetical protein